MTRLAMSCAEITAPKTSIGASENSDGKGCASAAVEDLDALLHQEAERDRRHDDRQRAVRQHRLDDELLEGEPEHEERRRPARRRATATKRQAEPVHADQREEGRQHDELALGEVDRLGGLPEQREADGGERVDRSRRQARQDDLDELGHASPDRETGRRRRREPRVGGAGVPARRGGGPGRRSRQLAGSVALTTCLPPSTSTR